MLRSLAVVFYHEAPYSDPADYHRLLEVQVALNNPGVVRVAIETLGIRHP